MLRDLKAYYARREGVHRVQAMLAVIDEVRKAHLALADCYQAKLEAAELGPTATA